MPATPHRVAVLALVASMTSVLGAGAVLKDIGLGFEPVLVLGASMLAALVALSGAVGRLLVSRGQEWRLATIAMPGALAAIGIGVWIVHGMNDR